LDELMVQEIDKHFGLLRRGGIVPEFSGFEFSLVPRDLRLLMES
jgi:hypothetical protein